MSQTKKEKKAKKKGRLDAASWIIIIGLLIIAVPCAAFLYILLSAQAATGTAISGDRFTGDLDPAITETQMANVVTSVETIEGVESAEMILKSATVRVYVDTLDEMTPEVAEGIANQAYEKLTAECDPSVYFTQTASKKMYDIEVHAYNLTENRDSEEFVYVILSKSSSMEAPIARLVSEPLDPELAAQLLEKLDRKLNPEKYETNSDEITVGEGEIVEGEE
jgi:flagellar basal body-associated protein FliL